MEHPLVYHYLEVVVVDDDTTDRMANYGETGSLGKGFSILETKGLIGLDAVPMKSKGLDIVLLVANVGATMC